MPDQATNARPRPRRRLLWLGLIALMFWIVGIALFLLTNDRVVPYLQYQVTSRVPLFSTPTPTALPTATAAPTSVPCTPTPTQPCAVPTPTPPPSSGVIGLPPLIPGPLNLADIVGFSASVISIIGAIPPTVRFFLYATRFVRRRSTRSLGAG
jgi:hypothetical protein